MVLRRVLGLDHRLDSRRDRPEGALERVRVRGARGGGGESVRGAHPLRVRRVGVVAAPLPYEHSGPTHRTEVRRSDRDRGQAPSGRVLARRRWRHRC